MNEIRASAVAYLGQHHAMSLATVGPDGPWAASVFYVNDGFDLVWLSEPTARHSRNIDADPRVAATINEDTRDWRAIRGIQVEGRAEVVGPVLRTPDVLALYVARFTFLRDPRNLPDTIRRGLEKTWFYRLRPDRVYYLDNSGGLGNRVEVPIV